MVAFLSSVWRLGLGLRWVDYRIWFTAIWMPLVLSLGLAWERLLLTPSVLAVTPMTPCKLILCSLTEVVKEVIICMFMNESLNKLGRA